MIRRNQEIRNVINVLGDIALIIISYFLALGLRYDLMKGIISVPVRSTSFVLLALGYACLAVICYAALHLYRLDKLQSAGVEIIRILTVNTLGTLLLMAWFFAVRITNFSRLALVIFWLAHSVLVIGKHLLVQYFLRRAWRLGYNRKYVIVVGNGHSAKEYTRNLSERPYLGFQVLGYVGAEKSDLSGHLGKYEDLETIVATNRCDLLVLALEAHEVEWVRPALKLADKEGLRVEMIPFFSEFYPANPTFEAVGGTKLINLRATPLDNIANAALKRTGDIFLSVLALFLVSPIMLLIALGIKLTSPGPVIFKQERIGKDKKPFMMLKFRSMRMDIDHEGWSKNEDSRKTRFGSFIRKFSLDELPQLWNVLKGDMSLVGPRPEIPRFVAQFKEEIALYLVRQQVRPGMTGWAQVNGFRGDTSIKKRVEYDIYYIENWSLGLDILILLKTVFGGMVNSEKLS